ncbi:MAG: tetratricopeptide repeat protein [Bacteroidia bacterium]|nr:tetratricopeptide repeat protein [Bacteroidia bacterium]
MKIYIFLFFILFLINNFSPLSAQNKKSNKTDSLEKVLQKTAADTSKIRIYNDLSKEYLFLKNLEKVEFYANEVIKISKNSTDNIFIKNHARALNYLGKVEKRKNKLDAALKYYEKSLKLSQQAQDNEWISRNYNNIGELYVTWGKFSSAIECYDEALKLKKQAKDQKGIGITLNSIGMVYLQWGKNEEAIKMFQESLKIFEQMNNQDGDEYAANTHNNLGNIYQNMNVGSDTTKLVMAMNYYKKSYNIFNKLKKENNKADVSNNMGNIYLQMADIYKKMQKKFYKSENKTQDKILISKRELYLNKGIEQYLHSYEIRKESNYKIGIAASLTNLGAAYSELGSLYSEKNKFNKTFQEDNFKKAFSYLQEALKLNQELNNQVEISITFYYIAQNYHFAKKYTNAIQYLDEAQEIAQHLKVKKVIVRNYQLFSDIYDSLRNYKKALDYSRLYSIVQDSITNETSVKAIQEMQTKYETEKKEQQIKQLDLEKNLQETQIKQQRLIIIAFVGGFIIILIFSIIIYKQYREKKKANILLAEQKHEIEKQKNIAEKQRDHISSQKKEIDDSIRYAKRIQTAVLPQPDLTLSHVKDMFIMFHPKDVVSGDFYFCKYMEHAKVFIAAAADCTGHGVPGAFMSMLGVTFLNEICSKPDIRHANEVLNMLRDYIIASLHQTGKFGEQKDGMDISLVAIFEDPQKLEFSGANNPLYIIRNNELIEYKGDKMPIGIHDMADKPFTNVEITYQKEDCLYLFSDGLADQFGGDKGKKYLYRRLKEFCLSVHQKPMAEQHDLFVQEFVSWRGKYEQIDDQLVMGIKL